MDIIQKIKEELQVEKWQVEAAVKLIDEGNTIPFISRYRKEVTGSLNDEQLRNLDERLTYLRSLEDKKEQVLKSIEEQGKLTDELKEKELKLNLAIKENEDFSVGLGENRSITITWSQKIMQPTTWRAMRFFFCSTYSTQVYKIFMQVTGLKEFYYYEGIVSVDEAYVMGRNFGNVLRAYEKEHGTPMLHDDGTAAGTPIVPLH